MAVAEDVGGYCDGVADAALGRVAATVDGRRRELDLDPLGRLAAGLGCGHYAAKYPVSRRIKPPTRIPHKCPLEPAASNCIRLRCRAAGSGATRTRSSTGSPTPGRRGGRCCRWGRRTATGRRTSRLGVRRRRRGCSATPAAPVSKAEELDFRERQGVLGRRLGALRAAGRRRRPGALRPRVERAARLRERARRAAHGRHRRSTWRRGRPTTARIRSCSRPASWRACRPTRSPPIPGSCGATRCTTGRRCGGVGYGWWVERLRRTFELFDLARIDHFRGFVAYWAVPADAKDARCRAAGSAGPGRARVRTRPRRWSCRSTGCRWWRRTSA